MCPKDTIATLPASHYIRRISVILERIKRHRLAPFAMPTLQELGDALESLEEIERKAKDAGI